VPYAVLLGIVGRTLGKFQSAEKLTQAQADWCKARVDEAAKGAT
jgi:hypothetical protein